jgi:hypothetical protein
MISYFFALVLSSCYFVLGQQNATGNVSDIMMANMLVADLPLLFHRDQMQACEDVRNPTGFASCQNAISDPIAQCCYVKDMKACIGIPTASASLYKTIFQRENTVVDCPLIKNATIMTGGETLMTNAITKDEATRLVRSIRNVKLPEDDGERCSSVNNPTGVEMCSKAFRNNQAKCCLFKGNNGTNSASFCNFVPNDAFGLYSKLYGSAKINITCS